MRAFRLPGIDFRRLNICLHHFGVVPKRHMASPSAPDSRLPSLQELEQQLVDSIEAVEVYREAHPAVSNLRKLTSRIRCDLSYVQQLSKQPDQSLTETRLQGVMNNLKGFRGELLALQEAPGVVAVCTKFRAPVLAPASTANLLNVLQQQQTGPNGMYSNGSSSSSSDSEVSDDSFNGDLSGPEQGITSSAAEAVVAAAISAEPVSSSHRHIQELQVEVDVVADKGLTWIEVKNQERFGLGSNHYLGGSHAKGLAEQVSNLLAVAASCRHRRRGRSPQVVVFFPSGVEVEVADALRALGARVADGPGSLRHVCGVSANNVTNLDVTALCALVSQVSWGDPAGDALQAWAARTPHWQECLAAQQERPLLPELAAAVDQDHRLVVSCVAVKQFQVLMDQYSGPMEQQRWHQLLQRLQVYHCSSTSSSTSSADSTCEHCGGVACSACGVAASAQPLASSQASGDENPAAATTGNGVVSTSHGPSHASCLFVAVPARLQNLPKFTPLQQAVFGLGDGLHAVTLTANGSAVRIAAACGVELDVQLHRPVWLTGL